MPYIKQFRRQLADLDPQNSGELNYRLTEICKDYLDNKGLNYNTINDIVGALECCKHEFIRRVVNPYEDEKIEENGDVY